MIVVCKNCGESQERDNIFCITCGTKLVQESGLGTMPIDPAVVTTKLQNALAPRPSGGARLNLHIVRSGQILPLDGPGEYIVGRVSSGQSILPDVNLEPYAAYEAGVSRLHVRIKIQDDKIWVTDLGSANGTRLNNEKLAAHQAYPLNHKDILRLGRLSIQALTGD